MNSEIRMMIVSTMVIAFPWMDVGRTSGSGRGGMSPPSPSPAEDRGHPLAQEPQGLVDLLVLVDAGDLPRPAPRPVLRVAQRHAAPDRRLLEPVERRPEVVLAVLGA